MADQDRKQNPGTSEQDWNKDKSQQNQQNKQQQQQGQQGQQGQKNPQSDLDRDKNRKSA